LTFFSKASRMRAQGFGMMAELKRDIVYQNDGYQNIESARVKTSGEKTNLEIMSSSVYCRAASVLQYRLSVKFIARRTAY
jgi:hypothetical protein